MNNYNYSPTTLELFELPGGAAVRKALDILWAADLTLIRASVQGEGDCGTDCSVSLFTTKEEGFKYDTDINTRYKSQKDDIRDWMWRVATKLYPGFEIDDGGRVELTLTREGNNISLQAVGYGYFVQESKQFEIKEAVP